MLKIGEFSKLSRVSIRMLRRYNEVGLLLPAETDPITGYRYYSEDQLPAAGRITALRDMGFGLAAIEQLLATCDYIEDEYDYSYDDEGWGDYVEDDGWGDYADDEGWGDIF